MLLERRIGEQRQMLVSLADNLDGFNMDGDELSEDERRVDITALFVDKEVLTVRIRRCTHMASSRKRLGTKGSWNLKQEQRKHNTHKVGAHEAWNWSSWCPRNNIT